MNAAVANKLKRKTSETRAIVEQRKVGSDDKEVKMNSLKRATQKLESKTIFVVPEGIEEERSLDSSDEYKSSMGNSMSY